MSRIFACVVSLVLTLTTLAGVVSAAEYTPDTEELSFLGLINDYRDQVGVRSLTLNTELGAAAEYHSYDMATFNYFAHSLSDGSDAGQNIANFGYNGDRWGEIIAAGMATAPEALLAWRNSPSHDAAMRNGEFKEIGIGRYYDPNSFYGWYWTATFGADSDRHQRKTDPGVVVVETTQETDPAAPPAETAPPTSVDGTTVHADDTTNPTAEGGGQDLIYGDIETGGDQGTVQTTDPNLPPPSVTDLVPPPPSVPTHSDVANGTTSVENSDGTATTYGDTPGPTAPPADTAGAPPPAPASPASTCGDFPSWYDAQVAYEAAGGLGADAALVASVDPDYDGIACEEMMVT
jgi:uncharacterized protein YkwD